MLNKKLIDEEFKNNKPAQTRKHSGDNMQRVGCAVAKVTLFNEREKKNITDKEKWMEDLKYNQIDVVNATSKICFNLHLSEISSFHRKKLNSTTVINLP